MRRGLSSTAYKRRPSGAPNMDLQLSGKTALVTGASAGIGTGIA
jgi:hypothetical protein